MAQWKENLIEPSRMVLPTDDFTEAKKFFAVDISGATWGRVFEVSVQMVKSLSFNAADTVSRWDGDCEPKLVSTLAFESYRSPGPHEPPEEGTTNPEDIVEQGSAFAEIRSSDIWLLLTDGQIPPRDVSNFNSTAMLLRLADVPVVLVVVGLRAEKSPRATKIPTVIPLFVAFIDAVILYKNADRGLLSVVAAKGCFRPLYPNMDSLDDPLASWDGVPVFEDENEFVERCSSLGILVFSSRDRSISKGVSLGSTYSSVTDSSVNIDRLLRQHQVDSEDLRDLLEEEAFDNLAIACKTRDCLIELRKFLTRHKRQEVAARLEDRHGARNIVRQMQTENPTSAQMDRLRSQLQAAHVSNRLSYTRTVQSPSEEARATTEHNMLMDRALALVTGIEKAGNTADRLVFSHKHDRAMRADMIQASDSNLQRLAMDLSDNVKAFRSTCSICAGNEQIMSIVLKRPYTAEGNASHVALEFPLDAGCDERNVDLVSSQCICFQCALVCGKSIYEEAIVPTTEYTGVNTRYLDHQIRLAIAAGSNTGSSAMAQFFMTILDRVLETKSWCRIDEGQTNREAPDHEKSIRRQAFSWMRKTILQNSSTRKTFTDVGSLRGTIKDCQNAGVNSWVVQYPLKGFCQMIRWYGMIDQPVDASKVELVRKTKLMHLVVSKLMDGGKSTCAFMRLIYCDLNAPGVPRDMHGRESIVSPAEFWQRLEEAMGNQPDVESFLSSFSTEARVAMCRRIQLAVFWAIFTEQLDTTARDFFRSMARKTAKEEPLAKVILCKPKDLAVDVPEAPAIEVLTSIFSERSLHTDEIHSEDKFPPFVSPFGASVLRCGLEGCNVRFFTPKAAGEPATMPDRETVRRARDQHFREVFCRKNSYGSGLPGPTRAPKAPSSSHNNLHQSIAKVWSRQDRPTKQHLYLGNNEPALDTFVSMVIFEVCVTNGQGNIYQSGLDKATRDLLPSFFEALRQASGRLGLEDPVDYVHDWNSRGSLAAKIEYECLDGLPL